MIRDANIVNVLNVLEARECRKRQSLKFKFIFKNRCYASTLPWKSRLAEKNTVRGKEFREVEKLTGANPSFGQEQNIQVQGEKKII